MCPPSLGRVRSAFPTPRAPGGTRTTAPPLFPLPYPALVGEGGRGGLRSARARARARDARALSALAWTVTAALNFVEGGCRPRPRPPGTIGGPSQQEAGARVLAGCRAMLRVGRGGRDEVAAALRTGRGKAEAVEAKVEEIGQACVALRACLVGSRTRQGVAIGEEGERGEVGDRGLDVSTRLIKLPPPGTAGCIPPARVAELLGPRNRAAFLDPGYLEGGTLDELPPLGPPPGLRPCDRVRGEEVGAVLRALDESGMLWVGPARRTAEPSCGTPEAVAPEAAAAAAEALGAVELGEEGRAAPAPLARGSGEETGPQARGGSGEASLLRDVGVELAGLFAVRKAYCARLGEWLLRLILDRRRRNAAERAVSPEGPGLPHGSQLAELGPLAVGEIVLGWLTDLPQYYYRLGVSEARARSNAFRVGGQALYRTLEELEERAGAPLAAVEAARTSARLHGCPAPGWVTGLKCMAMGDVNATAFAQDFHTALLREGGGLPPACTLDYRQPPPRGRVWEGVYIDDHAVVSVTGPGRGKCEEAWRLHNVARAQYAAAGVPDSAEKRAEGAAEFCVWGAEVRGKAGDGVGSGVGVPRVKRWGVCVVATQLALLGHATLEVLRTVVGLLVDAFLYRRPLLAVVGAAYSFIEAIAARDAPASTIWSLPGPVRSELLVAAALLPMAETPLHGTRLPTLYVTDASLEGVGVVGVNGVPAACMREIARTRVRPGVRESRVGAPGSRRGDDAIGELLEGLPSRRVLAAWRFRRRPRSIHEAEAIARFSLVRGLARTPRGGPPGDGTWFTGVHDSAVIIGSAVKGRCRSTAVGAVNLRTAAHTVAGGLVESSRWTSSETNCADDPSRGRWLHAQPSAMREWVAAFLGGEVEALAERQAGARGIAPVPEAAEEARPRGVGQGGHAGERVGEASHPGPGVERAPGVAARAAERAARRAGGPRLEELRRGIPSTVARRARLLPALALWLEDHGRPPLRSLVGHPQALGEALGAYGDAMYADGAPQSDFAETLNAVQKEFSWVQAGGGLRLPWEINAAWEAEEPGRARAAVPAALVRAVAAVCLLWGERRTAVLFLLAWEGALRPGDVVGLRRVDLRTPDVTGDVTPGPPAMYVVLHHSKTRARAARVQHVRIVAAGLIRAVREAFAGCRPDEPLFETSVKDRASKLGAMFGACLRALRVPHSEADGYTVAGLRPGGLTALFRHCGDLAVVKWRGRWTSAQQLEFYIQELEGAEAYARLPVDVRAEVELLSGRLPSLLSAGPPPL